MGNLLRNGNDEIICGNANVFINSQSLVCHSNSLSNYALNYLLCKKILLLGRPSVQDIEQLQRESIISIQSHIIM